MSTRASASLTRWVINSSAWLGFATPEGGLCAMITAGAFDRAAEQLLILDQAMALIEIEAAKYFVFQIAKLRGEKIPGRPGAGKRRSGAQGLRQLPSRDLDRG